MSVDGTSRPPVYNNLRASLQPNGSIALLFDNYAQPRRRFQYIVKAMVVTQSGAEGAVVTFGSFGAAAVGILVNVSNVTNPDIIPTLELMVEISQYDPQG